MIPSDPTPDHASTTPAFTGASPRARRDAARGAGGFTIVEILIAVIVSGIIGAAVFGLLLEQNDFYRTSQNTLAADVMRRGVADLVSSELRMLAPGDLYRTKGDSIRARFNVRHGVVCENVSGGSGMKVFYYHVADTQLPGGPTGSAVSSPWAGGYTYEDTWAPPTMDVGDAARIPCGTYGGPTGYPDERYRVEDWSGRPSGFGGTDPGGVIRVYNDIVYTFKPSTTGKGLALWRNDVELAAPFADGAGFAYVMNTGSKEKDVPNSNHNKIVRIRIEATALGSGGGRYDVAQDLSIDVPFRNRVSYP